MTHSRSPHQGRRPSRHPNPVDIHVGERLRHRRTELGLSQERLAELMGLTFQQIQKYENGSNRIGASRLFDIAHALGVTVDYFYDEMGDEVKAASPRHLSPRGADRPASPDGHAIDSRETLDLIRLYYCIDDPVLRRQVHDLARSLSEPKNGKVSPRGVRARRRTSDLDG